MKDDDVLFSKTFAILYYGWKIVVVVVVWPFSTYFEGAVWFLVLGHQSHATKTHSSSRFLFYFVGWVAAVEAIPQNATDNNNNSRPLFLRITCRIQLTVKRRVSFIFFFFFFCGNFRLLHFETTHENLIKYKWKKEMVGRKSAVE